MSLRRNPHSTPIVEMIDVSACEISELAGLPAGTVTPNNLYVTHLI